MNILYLHVSMCVSVCSRERALVGVAACVWRSKLNPGQRARSKHELVCLCINFITSRLPRDDH